MYVYTEGAAVTLEGACRLQNVRIEMYSGCPVVCEWYIYIYIYIYIYMHVCMYTYEGATVTLEGVGYTTECAFFMYGVNFVCVCVYVCMYIYSEGATVIEGRVLALNAYMQYVYVYFAPLYAIYSHKYMFM